MQAPWAGVAGQLFAFCHFTPTHLFFERLIRLYLPLRMVVFSQVLHQNYFSRKKNYSNVGFKVYILSNGGILLKRKEYVVAH